METTILKIITKKEITQYISKFRQSLSDSYEIFKKNGEIKTEIDDNNLLKCIRLVDSWVESILYDLECNLIPWSFYGILKNDIDNKLPVFNDVSFKEEECGFLYQYFAKRISNIENLVQIYSFYKVLGYAQKTTVLIGANGCGKTILANLLQETLNVNNGIVIPAQKLLIFPSFANTPNYDKAEPQYNQYQKEILNDKITYEAKEMDSFDYSIARKYGSEMVKVMGLLLGQRQIRINIAARKVLDDEDVAKEEFRGILDDVIDIWNNLIQHRTLFCTDSNELKIRYNSIVYNAHEMSDGERIIIYLAGRVLSAPLNGIIIVDEPELHLHKSIANKLWDILEAKRSDCRFIYFTHDLDFATSRNCQRGWIKEFIHPDRWHIELIEENEIPEELLLKLLGSRKPVLFCEGEQSCLDNRMFEILFPNYTIQGVGSCKNVINFTKAYNRIPTTYCKAYGIIDKDFRNEVQLRRLSDIGVFSYDIAEIENLFLTEEFLKEYAIIKHESLNFQDIKDKVFAEFSKCVESQISFYIAAFINFTFNESNIKQASTKDCVQVNFMDFISKIDVEKIYIERQTFLQEILDTKNYAKLISVANNKGLLKIIAQSFGLKGRDEYISRALSVLVISPNAQSIIKSHLPSQL